MGGQFDRLKSQLKELEPLFFDGQEGTLRVLEKLGRCAIDIEKCDSTDEEQIISSVKSALAEAAWRFRALKLIIHLPFESIGMEDVCRALVVLADFLGANTETRIIIHHDELSCEWSAVQGIVKSLRDTLSRPREVNITLISPFTEFLEPELTTLFNLGLQIRFGAGWRRSCPSEEVPPIDTEVLRKFSEFGFRTVIEWYVHAGNIQAFEEQMSELLIANFSSGFSLPLISQNPYFRFGAGSPALPNALEYCQLLTRIYSQHPYYDDVFDPLSGLASLISPSEGNLDSNVPIVNHVILNSTGQIGIFRQAPGLAFSWMTVSEVVKTPLETLRQSFVKLAGRTHEQDWIPYCRPCRWRNICGGLDDTESLSLTRMDMDTLCGHKKLFLEHFAKLRAPDCVFGKLEKQ